MSVEKPKTKKIGYVFSNKNIPMHNLFNRTPCFLTPHENNNRKVIDESFAVEFKNKQYKNDKPYKLKLYGSQLNHKTDYPLLALIIKNLVNKRQTEHEATSVKLDLKDIDELFNFNFSGKRKSNYDPIVFSLERLLNVKIQLIEKVNENIEYLPLIAGHEFHYGKGKKQSKFFQIEISELLNHLYIKMWNVTFFDFSYIDVEAIVNINTENAKALIKYFMCQNYDFIDFKFDTLVTLLGFKYKNMDEGLLEVDENEARSKIKDALKLLIEKKFLTQYKCNETRSWDRVRIIPQTLCDNVDISERVIDLLPSNFDKFKNKPVIDEKKEELKRTARLDPEVQKYPYLIILIKEIE